MLPARLTIRSFKRPRLLPSMLSASFLYWGDSTAIAVGSLHGAGRKPGSVQVRSAPRIRPFESIASAPVPCVSRIKMVTTPLRSTSVAWLGCSWAKSTPPSLEGTMPSALLVPCQTIFHFGAGFHHAFNFADLRIARRSPAAERARAARTGRLTRREPLRRSRLGKWIQAWSCFLTLLFSHYFSHTFAAKRNTLVLSKCRTIRPECMCDLPGRTT